MNYTQHLSQLLQVLKQEAVKPRPTSEVFDYLDVEDQASLDLAMLELAELEREEEINYE
jgi:hypothetical protein